MTVVVTTKAGLTDDAAAHPQARAVVMTMGALHDGHAELMREARRQVGPDGRVIVTIFVNPTQFAAGEDFDAYPRTLDDDVAVCAEEGVDVVFAPSATEVYGPSAGFRRDSITIDPGPLGDVLEGASRAGHFRGTLTVVAKLMAMTRPDVALFGEKDYQQLTLIRRMVDDLDLNVRVVGVPTVRESDGLARSSRNRFLNEDERACARVIPQALAAARAAAGSGAEAARAAGLAVLDGVPEVEVDYFVVTDPDLGAAPSRGEGRILIAARAGATRLIDNCSVTIGR